MKKYFLAFFLISAFFLSGCAKGEITLDISRWGAADVSCKVVAAPILRQALGSFEKDFTEDGYQVIAAKDHDMEGFEARKHYANLRDIKDSKVLETFRFEKLQQAAQKNTGTKAAPEQPKAEAKTNPSKAMLTVEPGLLFDRVIVNTGLNMNGGKEASPEAKVLLGSIFKDMELKFVVKLPVAADSSDATTVSEDGKTLTWNLALGSSTPINATITYLNPIKAASWCGGIILLAMGVGFYYSYAKRKKQLQGEEHGNK